MSSSVNEDKLLEEDVLGETTLAPTVSPTKSTGSASTEPATEAAAVTSTKTQVNSFHKFSAADLFFFDRFFRKDKTC